MSILERIGEGGLLHALWASTPSALRIAFLPYSFLVYRDLLAQSKNLNELLDLHGDLYKKSALFRLLRPRYSSVRRVLNERYGIE